MTSLRVGWTAKQSATRRFWRIYSSPFPDIKGDLVAEVPGNATAYVIRDVKPGKIYVRVLAVNNAGTEDDWKSAAALDNVASKVITRTSQTPEAPVSAGAAQVSSAVALSVVMDPPAENAPDQEIEVIQGGDPSLGQLVAVAPAPRGSDTGQSGQRAAHTSFPAPPGRTSTRRLLSIRGRTTGSKHPGSAVTVPITTVNYPNHDATVIGSVVTGTLTNIYAPVSNQRWEAGTYGVRLRAVPTTDEWDNSATSDGWGLSGTGILAAEPSGAYYMTAATITISTYDLGSSKDCWIECYDEAQRDPAGLALASIASSLWAMPSNPVENPELAGDDRNWNWAMTQFRCDGKPVRPLPPTRWQYRFGDAEPLGTWLEYVPGVRVNARYIQARMILDEPTGLSRVLVPYAYCRAWTPHAATTHNHVRAKDGDAIASEIKDLKVTTDGAVVSIRTVRGDAKLQVNIGGTIYSVALTS